MGYLARAGIWGRASSGRKDRVDDEAASCRVWADPDEARHEGLHVCRTGRQQQARDQVTSAAETCLPDIDNSLLILHSNNKQI